MKNSSVKQFQAWYHPSENTAIGKIQQISNITPLQVQERNVVQIQQLHAVVSAVTNEVKRDTSTEVVSDIKIMNIRGSY